MRTGTWPQSAAAATLLRQRKQRVKTSLAVPAGPYSQLLIYASPSLSSGLSRAVQSSCALCDACCRHDVGLSQRLPGRSVHLSCSTPQIWLVQAVIRHLQCPDNPCRAAKQTCTADNTSALGASRTQQVLYEKSLSMMQLQTVHSLACFLCTLTQQWANTACWRCQAANSAKHQR